MPVFRQYFQAVRRQDMPSKIKSVREAQKTKWQTAVSARRNALKERGLDQAGISKDTKLKALMAKLRQIHRTLAAILAKEKKNEQLEQHKQERTEKRKLEKAEKKKSSKKKAGEKTKEPGKKEKKEKKKPDGSGAAKSKPPKED
jgi:hypothetical protein